MKLTKQGIYKASNVTFNPNTLEAYSYDWWQFVKVIRGKVIFNSYRYSNTTARHQSKVRQVMVQLGIKIDLEVQVRGGLQDIKTIKALNVAHNHEMGIQAEVLEQKRLDRNAKARTRCATQRELNRQREEKHPNLTLC